MKEPEVIFVVCRIGRVLAGLGEAHRVALR